MRFGLGVPWDHYNDIIMGAMPSKITSFTIVYSAVNSGADQRKHQSSASLAFVRGIHRRPVNSPHKGPVTRKMFPFDDVVMYTDRPTSSWWLLMYWHPATNNHYADSKLTTGYYRRSKWQMERSAIFLFLSLTGSTMITPYAKFKRTICPGD